MALMADAGPWTCPDFNFPGDMQWKKCSGVTTRCSGAGFSCGRLLFAQLELLAPGLLRPQVHALRQEQVLHGRHPQRVQLLSVTGELLGLPRLRQRLLHLAVLSLEVSDRRLIVGLAGWVGRSSPG